MAGRVSPNLTFQQQHKKKSGMQEGLYWYNWRPDAPRRLQTEVLYVVLMQMTITKYFKYLVWNENSSCVKQLDLSDSRPTAAIMSPPLAAVSTVRALTSSIAVYSSCPTQTLLQLLKHITVLVLSSTGTGTSTSTTLLQD